MHAHIQKYIAAVAKANGVANPAENFSVSPSVSQKMREKVRESSAFLKQINIVQKKDIAGEIIGIGAGLNASRTKTDPKGETVARKPKAVHTKTGREYRCEKVNFDTMITYEDMDNWSAHDNYIELVNRQIVKSKALSLIAIGFNGIKSADNSNAEENPLLQDIKKGWLQQLREGKAENVLGSSAEAVTVGATGKYKNLDAIVVDACNELIDDEFAEMPDMVVLCHRTLLGDKYFAVTNAAEQTATEQVAAHAITASKRLGGLTAIAVPYFPKNTMLITPLSNLSIYFHKTGHRRELINEPRFDRVSDYQSENIDYVVEEFGAAALIENIKIAEE
ncbi:phage major capsid protein, P2 family [Neisseria sp. N95_16]|uniref:Phage major capsid protein, P2 family n=1 Tax=Neisseria brasiliensis TaxID=2666100 RepID=A0A5Q3RVQ1_9NEIS|nr:MULTISPECIES: phage major capsid protein, P2 family [Neisseria]MRN37190.1 phage major capsid protein, P2 family [Neisseria brasiliensis]PJO10091.1 phage major capsid protein, P2 family [Neisseria sp. N95_16]PJO78755.1 phage major capsid protein, P2 family [Neisseria sp. N177_16]QGL24199.1 phage major capsid protein, P2 family [Neisseria brasiliensis]